jgi:hypothetical protein
MSPDHVVHTSELLSSTESVLHAGRRLGRLADASPAKLQYAITRLEQAALLHDAGGTGYRAFMFSELEATPEEDKEKRERVTEDALVSILTDMQVANVLIAAGQTAGEMGERADPSHLNTALRSLENTAHAMERSLATPLAEGAEPGRFGFEETAAAEPIQSADVPAAKGTFQDRVGETIDMLVQESQSVATNIFDALSKIDQEKVVSALSKLGLQIQELPKVGRLIRLGIEKLEKAFDALISLLGSEVLAQAKDKVKETWKKVQEGEHVSQALEWVFAVKKTRARVKEVMGVEGLQIEPLDKASDDLAKLAIRFKESMKMARSMMSTVTAAGAFLALTPLAGPTLALLTASLYTVILAGVILIGMDYADTGRILKRVRGVGEIVSSLQPV